MRTCTPPPNDVIDLAGDFGLHLLVDVDCPGWRYLVGECLTHTCALDFPSLEILVVDDGSEDETSETAAPHPRARLHRTAHAGRSAARNAGFQEATVHLIAQLDSEAYPPPEWLYHLALGLDGPTLGGVGGPNVPPTAGTRGAQAVAPVPGGPVPPLVTDDRAEHIPGCRFRWRAIAAGLGVTPVAGLVQPVLAAVLLVVMLAEAVRGGWRTGPAVRRALVKAAA